VSQHTTNQSFDDLARALAEGSISRRRALRLFAGTALAALIPSRALAEDDDDCVRICHVPFDRETGQCFFGQRENRCVSRSRVRVHLDEHPCDCRGRCRDCRRTTTTSTSTSTSTSSTTSTSTSTTSTTPTTTTTSTTTPPPPVTCAQNPCSPGNLCCDLSGGGVACLRSCSQIDPCKPDVEFCCPPSCPDPNDPLSSPHHATCVRTCAGTTCPPPETGIGCCPHTCRPPRPATCDEFC
jgi:hypothetical protein